MGRMMCMSEVISRFCGTAPGAGALRIERFSANDPKPHGTGPYANTGFGQRFSNAISYGNLVFITGQIGQGRGIREQTESALANVDAALAQAGASKEQLLE